MIYSSETDEKGVDEFNEKTASETGLFVETGHTIMNLFTEK
jgi:2,3-bisphosphoglycerate-independent phosphoglycerate mutase